MPTPKRNRKPRRPASGNIHLRLLPEEREAATVRAKEVGLSRNEYLRMLVLTDLYGTPRAA